MKATGIVRRIDDLGRVVIPKEIRRTLRLREGTPLEIFTDREGEIILKKYSPMVELAAFAVQYAEAMAQSTGADGLHRGPGSDHRGIRGTKEGILPEDDQPGAGAGSLRTSEYLCGAGRKSIYPDYLG